MIPSKPLAEVWYLSLQTVWLAAIQFHPEESLKAPLGFCLRRFMVSNVHTALQGKESLTNCGEASGQPGKTVPPIFHNLSQILSKFQATNSYHLGMM